MSISLPSYIANLVIKMVAKKAIKEISKKELGKNKAKIHAYREVSEHKSAILFLHGFTGHPTETFKNIPELLMSENQIDGYDIFSIGYSSSLIPDVAKNIWSADPDINSLSAYFKTLIETRFNSYNVICLVAHSMGGLIAQQGILKLEKNELKRIKYLLMFGTPSRGLNIANLRIARFLKPQIKNLGSRSMFITKLRRDWKERFNKGYPFDFRVIAGTSDEFIARESSLEEFHERYRYQIEGNHATMIKADNDEDNQNQCFRFILSCLSPVRINDNIVDDDFFRLNQFIANNIKIVDDLEDNVVDLDAKGLKKLALAYDSLSYDQKAIEVLMNHKLSNLNTDIMGIIGGRHKRMYLYSGSKEVDALNSINWYEKGYKISKEENDKEQIYYHAINLAFYSLVFHDDKDKMKSYAEIALENCDENSINIWELATIAEANLYLGNEPKSQEFYSKVLQMTKDKIRIRSSIYMNLKFAYDALSGVEY